jgi:hypothetical protein
LYGISGWQREMPQQWSEQGFCRQRCSKEV